jgi:hypothetical protein
VIGNLIDKNLGNVRLISLIDKILGKFILGFFHDPLRDVIYGPNMNDGYLIPS